MRSFIGSWTSGNIRHHGTHQQIGHLFIRNYSGQYNRSNHLGKDGAGMPVACGAGCCGSQLGELIKIVLDNGGEEGP